MRRTFPQMLMLVVVCLISEGASAAIDIDACDTNGDGLISEPEMAACLLSQDPKLKVMAQDTVAPADKAKLEADELACDAICDQPQARRDANGDEAIPIERARSYFRQRLLNTREPRAFPTPWEGFKIGRKINDAPDPRAKKYDAGFVVSYADDRLAGDDNFVALGDVQWWQFRGASDSSQISLNSSLDVSTKKHYSESSISLAAGWSKLWSYDTSGGKRLLHDLTVGIEPKYITDRDFRRDVVEVGVRVAPSSQILNAGLNTHFGGGSTLGAVDQYVFYWQPTLSIEAGRVTDSGDNAALEAIRLSGEYARIVPSISAKLSWPVSLPLSLNLSYAHRWDEKQDWNRGFGSAGVQYDVTTGLALTLIYRKGRKPPAFEQVEEILFGVALTQGK